MKRPWVVIPLFLLVLAGLVLPFVWPSPSADELYADARPLLESESPNDWQKAIEKYLDPLERKYPGRYAAEIAAARAKLKDRQELKRALADGAKVDPHSDAERAYLRGLRMSQAGDPDAARRSWKALVAAFGIVESERRWVDLAQIGLKSLDSPEARGRRAPPDRAAFNAALSHAKALDASGKTADAVAIYRALDELFHDDPVLAEEIRQAREKK